MNEIARSILYIFFIFFSDSPRCAKIAAIVTLLVYLRFFCTYDLIALLKVTAASQLLFKRSILLEKKQIHCVWRMFSVLAVVKSKMNL